MSRKQRRSIAIFIVGVFFIALVAGHSLYPAAIASDEVTVEVYTESELLNAIKNASDGDVIGISNLIVVGSSVTIGKDDKHVILQRTNPQAGIDMGGWQGNNSTIKNVTFDGNGISSEYPFLMINHDVTVENVVFKNNISTGSGGAVGISIGQAHFNNCLFESNTALNGGHAAIGGESIAFFNNCTFINGYAADRGGAIINSVTSSSVYITDSVITENRAENIGGGIINYGIVDVTGTKIYNNTAGVGGADTAAIGWANIYFHDSLEDLVELFSSYNIIPIGWVTDYIDETGNVHNTNYLRLEYEVIPTEVILDPESLGVAGDGKITGLEPGKYYIVIMDDIISYVKADGTLTTDEAEAEPLLGTEIVGLTNGLIYKVEEYTPPAEEEPEEPGDDEEPQDPIDEELPNEEEPEEEEPDDEKPGDEEPDDEEQEDETQDEQEQEEEQDETDQDKNEDKTPSKSNTDQITSSQEQSSKSSSSSRSTSDIAEINPNSSSTINNYFYGNEPSSSNYQTPLNTPYSLPTAQADISNPQTPLKQEQTIKIDAASLLPDGVKVQEDANGITINVNVNVGSDGNNGSGDNVESIQAQFQPDNGIPLVDVIKICLLFGILICVIRKPGS